MHWYEVLEREAGYIVVALLLIAAGVCLRLWAHEEKIGGDVIVFALGVLARSMTGKHGDTDK